MRKAKQDVRTLQRMLKYRFSKGRDSATAVNKRFTVFGKYFFYNTSSEEVTKLYNDIVNR